MKIFSILIVFLYLTNILQSNKLFCENLADLKLSEEETISQIDKNMQVIKNNVNE
jgi:hypothetical protein